MRRIRRIELHDVRGVHELIVDVPDRGMLILGTNGSGKSSVLNGAKGAITGADTGPDAISHGSERAELVAFSDNEVVRRLITNRGSRVTLKTPEGAALPKPQERLDRAAGELIDPLALRDAAPAERIEMVRRAIPAKASIEDLRRFAPDIPDGFDVSGHALDAARRVEDYYRERRRVANAAAKARTDEANRAKSEADATPAPPGAATNAMDAEKARSLACAELERLKRQATDAARAAGQADVARARLCDLRAQRAQITTADPAALEESRGRVATGKERVKECEQALEQAGWDLGAAERGVEDMERAISIAANLDARVADIEATILTTVGASPSPQDLARALSVLEAAEQARRAADLRQRAADIGAIAATAKAEADELDRVVKALATEAPRALLGESAIEGLEIRDGDIWLDGVRFAGLCGMEQLCLAVDLAKRAAGDLRVLFVDGLERIAEDQLDDVIGRATEGGFAFIATRVERGKIQFVTLDHVQIPATFIRSAEGPAGRLDVPDIAAKRSS